MEQKDGVLLFILNPFIILSTISKANEGNRKKHLNSVGTIYCLLVYLLNTWLITKFGLVKIIIWNFALINWPNQFYQIFDCRNRKENAKGKVLI